MTTAAVPRKKVTYRIDDRLIEALKEQARESNSSANNWLETHLFHLFKDKGLLPSDARPLGETRGGDQRKSSGDNDND